jgi:hypothetical protein
MTVWTWIAFVFGCAVVTGTGLLLITAAVGFVAARLWGKPTDNRAHRRA